ncbi:heme-binding protein [Paenibacillus filicis]|uniref:Heme-binding protein n=1 Tax=Paenibacillus gyeongsangnamensis TaxID=3388067 RepID=A0ABT4QAN3_9BACL|nr:heme-binding protein [Paenibacillus filicis]MCZ8513939.1 heme-binding protein [Paenibacillus filicis]
MQLTLNLARKLIELGKEKATKDFGRPISITIGDETGSMLTFDRMDGMPQRSIRISQQKAYTAARMGVSTDSLFERIQREHLEISYFCDPGLTALPGGNLLKNRSGEIIGCVGVSGLAPSEDHSITEYIAGIVSEEQAD